MLIDSYRFGEMLVNGRSFTSDLVIFSDHINDQWWRESGHNVGADDLTEIINSRPEVLVIGRGKLGAMKIPAKVCDDILDMGIQLVHARTEEAIAVYNQMATCGKNVIGAFHLTC